MTVKQVADMLHLSKNTIKYRMTKLPPEMIEKEDGIIYILEEGIKALQKGKKPSDNQPKEEERAPDRIDNHDEVVNLLKAQIEDLKRDKENLEKDKANLLQQLQAKDLQISDLTKSTLAFSMMKLEADTKKKGFFSKLIHRKKEDEP